MLNKKPMAVGSLLTAAIMISGCAQQSAISIQQEKLATPASWQSPNADEISNANVLKAENDWLTNLVSTELQSFINAALINNHQISQQRLAVKAAEQSAIASGASLWPNLDLSFSSSRRKNAATGDYTSGHDLSLSLRYEIDVWGKLSASDKQVNLQLASQLTQLQHAEQKLVSDIIVAWFSVAEAQQQLLLNQQRMANSKQNLAIIESGYEAGLNSALDVYLTRNSVASEEARVANQDSNLKSAIRKLEILGGQYPAGLLQVTSAGLPYISVPLAAGIPSEVLANNKDLQAQWFGLMAKDAGLAYAHKQRFPSITITGSVGTSSSDLSDLLSNSIGWSLIGGLTQPIFNAGRLQANEKRAEIEVKQAEQAYLQSLNDTFSTVENRITQQGNLSLSAVANEAAAKNAKLAEELSFEQYLKGLVSYTTVLDAQTRHFNAQSAAIQTQFQLLQNRLQLHLALGGDFNSIISNGSDNS